MPPKVKITKEEIINTAIDIIRSEGIGALNARRIAAELKCSTQPVFSNFATMDDLQLDVIRAAYGRYVGFLQSEFDGGAYPKYKAFGMAYIRFAKEERELFKLLFMRDRNGEDLTPPPDFDESVEMIMKANGVTREIATLMHLEIWLSVHGIATMMVTSFLELDEKFVSRMLSDVYHGVRAIHTKENVE